MDKIKIELITEKEIERLGRQITSLVSRSGESASFSDLFLKVHHNLGIKDFKNILEKMEKNGILIRKVVCFNKEDSKNDYYYLAY